SARRSTRSRSSSRRRQSDLSFRMAVPEFGRALRCRGLRASTARDGRGERAGGGPLTTIPGFSRASLLAYAGDVRRRYERELETLVELPSVSADPARAGDVRRTAAAAARLVRSLGGQATIVPTGGHPLVHARFQRDRRLPTVTIYNHLDVQPAD